MYTKGRQQDSKFSRTGQKAWTAKVCFALWHAHDKVLDPYLTPNAPPVKQQTHSMLQSKSFTKRQVSPHARQGQAPFQSNFSDIDSPYPNSERECHPDGSASPASNAVVLASYQTSSDAPKNATVEEVEHDERVWAAEGGDPDEANGRESPAVMVLSSPPDICVARTGKGEGDMFAEEDADVESMKGSHGRTNGAQV